MEDITRGHFRGYSVGHFRGTFSSWHSRSTIFSWPLTSTTALLKGVGTPSYVCATVRNYLDADSVWQEALANVAGFGAAGYHTGPAATNLFLNNAVIVTQDVTTAATTYTVSFEGTGTLDFTGTYTGSLVGTGAGPLNRVQKTFVATAGTLTCTVTGDVLIGQIQTGPYATDPVTTTGAPSTANRTELYTQTSGNLPTSGKRTIPITWTPRGMAVGTAQCIAELGYTDANNYTALFDNGVAIYVEKKVAGVSEFVACYEATVVGTSYNIILTINADNTMNLSVDGVSALTGLGLDLVVNGGFDTDTVWSKGAANWTISGGTANHTSGDANWLYQVGILTIGHLYNSTFTVLNYSAGGVRLMGGTFRIGNGTYTESLVSSFVNLNFAPDSGFVGSLDNVSTQLINNNTTTATPILATEIQLGELQGASLAYGEIKAMEVITG